MNNIVYKIAHLYFSCLKEIHRLRPFLLKTEKRRHLDLDKLLSSRDTLPFRPHPFLCKITPKLEVKRLIFIFPQNSTKLPFHPLSLSLLYPLGDSSKFYRSTMNPSIRLYSSHPLTGFLTVRCQSTDSTLTVPGGTLTVYQYRPWFFPF